MMKRRGFLSSLLAAPPLALAEVPKAETKSGMTLADHPGEVRDFLIKAAFVRVGRCDEAWNLDLSVLEHWRKHLGLVKTFDELTEHVASSNGIVWPLAHPPALPLLYEYTLRDNNWTYTTSSSKAAQKT